MKWAVCVLVGGGVPAAMGWRVEGQRAHVWARALVQQDHLTKVSDGSDRLQLVQTLINTARITV
jgi:hypothetical protein